MAHSHSVPSTPPGSSFSGLLYGSQPSSQPLLLPLVDVDPTQLNESPSMFNPGLVPLSRFDDGEDSEGSYMTDDSSFDQSDSESEARLSHDKVISQMCW